MIKVTLSMLLCVVAAVYMSPSALATQPSLKIQPLEYREFIATGEKKKGFIDISNPTYEQMKVAVEVQSFRQKNNKGELEFFDNPSVKQGIKTDYDTITLPPRQTLRMVFLIDGAKLPKGNVFATIFFSTIPDENRGDFQQVRIGTILSLVNQTPTQQQVRVEKMILSPLQLGDNINGSLSVKNTARRDMPGIYPRLSLRVDPLLATEYRFEGALVFPGITREKPFTIEESRFGIYRLSVVDNNDKTLASSWFIAATGWARLAVVGVFLITLGYGIHLRQKRLLTRQRARATEQ